MRHDATCLALSFDLDGTLVDTADEIAEAVNRTLVEFGLPAQPVEVITLLIGNGLRELMLKLLARLLLAQPALADRLRTDELLVRLDQHYADTVGTLARPYPGAIEALVALRAAGVRLACVTNKEGRHARHVLERSGLAGLVELLIAGDTLAQKKPHGSVLTEVARRLNVARERLVHVGDSRVDVEAARNAGVAAWAVPYGYNAGEPVAQAGPDRMFDDLTAVAAHVLASLFPSGAHAGAL
jgi:phosphoglycolate phosphatase